MREYLNNMLAIKQLYGRSLSGWDQAVSRLIQPPPVSPIRKNDVGAMSKLIFNCRQLMEMASLSSTYQSVPGSDDEVVFDYPEHKECSVESILNPVTGAEKGKKIVIMRNKENLMLRALVDPEFASCLSMYKLRGISFDISTGRCYRKTEFPSGFARLDVTNITFGRIY